jgi:endonuclease/exonuclease/phosphatase family metal-dependent hydrolase
MAVKKQFKKQNQFVKLLSLEAKKQNTVAVVGDFNNWTQVKVLLLNKKMELLKGI